MDRVAEARNGEEDDADIVLQEYCSGDEEDEQCGEM